MNNNHYYTTPAYQEGGYGNDNNMYAYEDEYNPNPYESQQNPYDNNMYMNNHMENMDLLLDGNQSSHPSMSPSSDVGSSGVSTSDGGSSGSAYGSVDFDDPAIADLPRILLMGPRRGGKTSIQRVVFHKMSPHETLFRLEATQSLERALVDHTPLCRFTIWDFPGDYHGGSTNNNMNNNYSLPQTPSSNNTPHINNYQHSSVAAGAGMMYADPYNSYANNNVQTQPQQHSLNGMVIGPKDSTDVGDNPTTQQEGNQDINMINGTNSDAYVYSRATALIFVIDAQDEPYDHVLQNFTETVTRAISVNPHIAIEVFINKVDGELFLSDEAKYDCRRDIMQQVSDELHDAGVPDVPIAYHLTSIYDHSIFEAFSRVVQKLIPQLPTLENLLNVLVSTCSMEKAYLFDVATKLYISTDSSPVDIQSVELCSDMIDVVLDVSGIYGLRIRREETNEVGEKTNDRDLLSDEADVTDINETDQEGVVEDEVEEEEEELIADSAYDSQSSSVIRLSNGMVLYLKEVDTMLALVCLTRAENFRKKGLMNYNIKCLKKALRMLVQPQNLPLEEEEEESQPSQSVDDEEEGLEHLDQQAHHLDPSQLREPNSPYT
eukprot:CAMPEP_0178962084 /NCGR_PEP_ID=MMETSP0789-20121207/14129_1 /TAXON_ID=3005 /ORGANISM="Rhizosolenia setigera, Strain CCMP 1694" /LENGTH=603 /DNA_ID=CAMNT_0020646117 /DNA_START=38 /DNA_END=1845 /DNA_ORIENTATION=+